MDGVTNNRYTQTPSLLFDYRAIMNASQKNDLAHNNNNNNRKKDDADDDVIKNHLPGPFVVFQGMEGDGMQNTIDSMPTLEMIVDDHNDDDDQDDEEEQEEEHSLTSHDYSYVSQHFEAPATSFKNENYHDHDDEDDHYLETGAEDYHHVNSGGGGASTKTRTGSDNSALLSSLDDDDASESVDHDAHSQIHSQSHILSDHLREQAGSSGLFSHGEDSFVVVDEDDDHPHPGGVIGLNKLVEDKEVVEYAATKTPRRKGGSVKKERAVSSTDQANVKRKTGAKRNGGSTLGGSSCRSDRSMNLAIKKWEQNCREKEESNVLEYELDMSQNQSNKKKDIQNTNNNNNILSTITTNYSNSSSKNASEITAISMDSSASSLDISVGVRKRRRKSGSHFVSSGNQWWQRRGKLLVFESVPSCQSKKTSYQQLLKKLGTVVGTLPAGCTVLGTDVVTFLADKSKKEASSPSAFLNLQFLQIESPYRGYVLYRRGGYSYLGHGLATSYGQHNEWFWRVTCREGAFVRGGLELNSSHKDTIPHGALVRVLRKTVNNMGLSRLRLIHGWASEHLNPLSGQRGPVLQPLPFPVPMLYRVVLSEGAVVRSGVELSSQKIRTAPAGSVLKVTGRAFSEEPADQCIARLRLAGGGGWVSSKLNEAPPFDLFVAEAIGPDPGFDPHNPGLYHWRSQQELAGTHAAAAERASAAIQRLSIDVASSTGRPPQKPHEANLTSPPHNTTTGNTKMEGDARRVLRTPSGSVLRNGQIEERCLICLAEERNSTLVHGATGHIASCLACSRILKARGDKCPVCRLPIDMVIQQFWA